MPRIVRARLFVAPILVLVIVAVGGAASAKSALPAGASYKGKGTVVSIATDGRSVMITKVPVLPKCKARSDGPARPTNLGEGLGPFTIEANGTFTNGQTVKHLTDGSIAISGRFSSDNKKVAGTVAIAAFKDSKGFDCKSFTGKFSATRVKASGGTPGKVLARDNFSSAKSGFDVFNTQNTFSEYLPDNRFRVGLRGAGTAVSLRKQPVATLVEVSATVLWFGSDTRDTFGLVCGATDARSFDAGLVRMDGQALLTRYVDGQALETSTPVGLPAGLLKAGKGDANQVTLACIPDANGTETHVVLSLNGQVVLRARSSAVSNGRTGVFAGGEAAGTDFNYQKFQVSIPRTPTTN